MNLIKLGSRFCGTQPNSPVLVCNLRQQHQAGNFSIGSVSKWQQFRLYGFGSHMNDNDPVHEPGTGSVMTRICLSSGFLCMYLVWHHCLFRLQEDTDREKWKNLLGEKLDMPLDCFQELV